MVRVGSLFSQLLKQIPRDTFHELVRKFGAERYAKGFASWTHLADDGVPGKPSPALEGEVHCQQELPAR